MSDDLVLRLGASASGVLTEVHSVKRALGELGTSTSSLASGTAAAGQAAQQTARGGLQELDRATQQVERSGGRLEGLLGRLGPAIVATFSVAALTAAIRSYARFGSELTDLAAKTGMTVEGVQRLKFAAEQSGVTFAQVSSASAQLAHRLMGDDKSVHAAYRRLGLDVEALTRLDPEQLFVRVADAVGQIENPTERAHVAMTVFGRSGAELLPLLTANVGELTARAERLGLVLSADAVQAAGELANNLDALKTAGQVVLGQVLQPLMPLLIEVTGALTKTGAAVTWLQDGFTDLLTAGFKAQRGIYAVLLAAAEGSREIPVLGKVFGASATDVEFFRSQVRYLDDVLGGMTTAIPNARREVSALAPPLLDTGDAAGKAGEALAKVRDALFGRDTIAKAQQYATALGDVANVAKLTAGQKTALRDSVLKALDAYRALGEQAPANLRAIETATRDVLEPTRSFLAVLSSPVLSQPDTLGHLLFSRDLGSLNERFQKLFKQPSVSQQQDLVGPALRESFWQSVFGTPQQAGALLTKTVVGAFQGGGSVAKSLGGQLGGMLTAPIANAFSTTAKVLTGGMSTAFSAIGSVIPVLGTLGGGALGSLLGKVFGGGEAKETRKMRDEFLASAGGLAEVRKQAEYADVSLTTLLSTKKTKTFQAEVQKLEAAVAAMDARIQALNTSLEQVSATGGLVTADLAAEMQALQGKEGGTAAIFAFMQREAKTATENISAWLEHLPIETETQASAAVGAILGLFDELQRQGLSRAQALEALGPSIQIVEREMERLGLAGWEEFSKLTDLVSFFGDELVQDVTAGTNAATGAMTSLANLALLNEEMFLGFASAVGQGHAELVAQGKDGPLALAALQPDLQRIWELQQQFGWAVDESTQALIDQAVESGQVGEQFRSVQDRMISAVEKLTERLGSLERVLSGGVAGAVATVDNQLARTDWSRWAANGVAAAREVEDAINGVSFGHSPGGLKEIDLALRRHLALARAWEREMSDAFLHVGAKVDRLGLSQLAAERGPSRAEVADLVADAIPTPFGDTGPAGAGLTVNLTVQAIDAASFRSVIKSKIAPEIVDAFRSNTAGTRTRLRQIRA
ncbi:MAG: hypothetical protein KJ066_16260 [Acidobacteria bacterium]|nr:hypothetical protein [Acidobacteriota bacterium]